MIDGASLVTTYRGSFNDQIQKGGIDGLVKTLAERNARRPPAKPRRRRSEQPARAEVLALEGALSFETIPAVLAQSAEYAARTDLPERLTIDFCGDHRGRFLRGRAAARVAPPGARTRPRRSCS